MSINTAGSLAAFALERAAVDCKIGSVGSWRGALMRGAKAWSTLVWVRQTTSVDQDPPHARRA